MVKKKKRKIKKTKWDLIANIKRAKNRKKVFLIIDKPIMPSELSNKIYGKSSITYLNIVSRALGELLRDGLVEVKNPKAKTGRLYELTKKGRTIKKEVKKYEAK
jgi:DNA-binding HxlR family transcriptional regulator